MELRRLSLVLCLFVCVISTFLRLAFGGNEPVEQFGFRIQGVSYRSSANLSELKKTGTWKAGQQELATSPNAVVKSAKESLSTIVDDSDKWVCELVELQRHADTNHWFWSVSFVSPARESGNVDSSDVATLGVHLNGDPFLLLKK